jgi:hypothetical protein
MPPQAQNQEKNSPDPKRRNPPGSKAPGGLSSLTEGLDLRSFLVAMAIVGGVTLIAWLASLRSPPPVVLPNELTEIQHEAGFKELIRKISPQDLAGHHRSFRELRPDSAIPHLGDAIPAAIPGDVSFVDLYTQFAVTSEMDAADEFERIMRLTLRYRDNPTHKQKRLDLVFKAETLVVFARHLKAECPTCSPDNIKQMARAQADHMFQSCLRIPFAP